MTTITRDMEDFLILTRREVGDNPASHEMLDADEVALHDYKIERKIGEGMGNMRDVYLAEHERLGGKRVVKIPKRIVKRKSFQTAVAVSKNRDWNQVEAEATQGIRHPNLSQTVDSFKLSDGRTVNVEHYYEGSDLETYLEAHGPIRDGVAQRKLAAGLVNGLAHAHSKGLIHRDMKPSNVILQEKDGEPVITDLQTAKESEGEEELFLPTRGGDSYTLPEILDAAVKGRKTKVGARNDIYGLGATLYSAFTGEKVSTLRIREDRNGNLVKIGDEEFKVALYEGSHRVDVIDSEFQTNMFDKADKVMKEKKVPSGMRKFIGRCLSSYMYGNMKTVSKEYQHLTEGFFAKLKRNVASGAKWFLPGLGVGVVLGGMIVGGIYAMNRERPPKLQDLLNPEQYRVFNLETLAQAEIWDGNSEVGQRLLPVLDDAVKRLPEIEKSDKYPSVDSVVKKLYLKEKMDPRLVSAWIRACYLHQESASKLYANGQEERIGPALVPKGFIVRVAGKESSGSGFAIPVDSMWEREKVEYAGVYLKQCLRPNTNVAEVFSRYFASSEEVMTAQAMSGTTDYFRGESTTGSAMLKGGNIMKHNGYAPYLPYLEQKLIDTAIALYAITDAEGNVHLEKAPKKLFLNAHDFSGQY